jgi:hypothetical protein
MISATPKHPNLLQDNNLTSPFAQNTAKSFIALLLPHFFPVSPLLHHSYKKIGGVGVARPLRPDVRHREGSTTPSAQISALKSLPADNLASSPSLHISPQGASHV